MENNQLAKAQKPTTGYVTIDGKQYQVTLAEPHQIFQQADRPAQYQTLKSEGTPPQSINPIKVPSMMTAALAAIVSLSFLVAASMFSISLTAYSNSVDRVDRPPYIRTD